MYISYAPRNHTRVSHPYTNHTYSVPGEPQNVRVNVLNSTALGVQWKPPQEKDRNGIIRGYHIHVQETRDEVSLDCGLYIIPIQYMWRQCKRSYIKWSCCPLVQSAIVETPVTRIMFEEAFRRFRLMFRTLQQRCFNI